VVIARREHSRQRDDGRVTVPSSQREPGGLGGGAGQDLGARGSSKRWVGEGGSDFDRCSGVLPGGDAPVTHGGRDEVLGNQGNDRGEGKVSNQRKAECGWSSS
jgi:hypothetical protein